MLLPLGRRRASTSLSRHWRVSSSVAPSSSWIPDTRSSAKSRGSSPGASVDPAEVLAFSCSMGANRRPPLVTGGSIISDLREILRWPSRAARDRAAGLSVHDLALPEVKVLRTEGPALAPVATRGDAPATYGADTSAGPNRGQRGTRRGAGGESPMPVRGSQGCFDGARVPDEKVRTPHRPEPAYGLQVNPKWNAARPPGDRRALVVSGEALVRDDGAAGGRLRSETA